MQRIGFCAGADGLRLAYAVHGQGPPLVKAANWLTHLEHDWTSPVWRHWLRDLGDRHTVVRYDERGCGLSDREVPDGHLGLETWVGDLEAVVDAAGVERFALLGVSQGAATAIGYAVRHPERVTHLVLYGGYALGRRRRGPDAAEEARLLVSLIRLGWGRPNWAFRQVFTSLFIPDGTPEQIAWFDELQRASASPDTAARLRAARDDIDVRDLAEQVTTPTLVLHAREDAMVPFAEGRRIATLIPDARFVPLESRNHILLADEPAWAAFLAEVRAALGEHAAEPGRRPDPGVDLSPRELEVLALVAQGLDNEQISWRLFLSVRTVERHLSNIYAKLGISGKAARTAAAVRYTELFGVAAPPRR